MRKRSQAGSSPEGSPVLPGEPDPWDLEGKKDAASPPATEDKQQDHVPRGVDFDRMAEDMRQRKSDGADAIVEVQFGEELFQPVQYNSFRHGGFKVAALVRKGETIEQACVRVFGELQRAFERTYPEKRDGYVQRLASLGAEVERLRR